MQHFPLLFFTVHTTHKDSKSDVVAWILASTKKHETLQQLHSQFESIWVFGRMFKKMACQETFGHYPIRAKIENSFIETVHKGGF